MCSLATPAGIFKGIRRWILLNFLIHLVCFETAGFGRCKNGAPWQPAEQPGQGDRLCFGGTGISSEQRLIPFMTCLEKAYPVKSFTTLLTSY